MTEHLNVLYIFDENYAVYSDVSIVSLLENNKDIDRITIYILDNNISFLSKEKIAKTVEGYSREIVYINCAPLNDLLEETKIPKYRGSSSTNMKLFAIDILPEKLDRLLYLDSDTIISNNLKDLLNINMQNCPIGMALDSVALTHKQCIGFNKDEKYYNAGVILYDVTTWRAQKCSQQIIQHVKEVRAHYPATDQDIFNVVFRKKIFTLNLKYNFQPFHLVYKPEVWYKTFGYKNYYTKAEIVKALAEPSVFHTFRYIGEFPWHKNNCHPCAEEFDHYLTISEWPEYIKKNSRGGVVFKMEKLLYKAIPLKIFIKIFNVFNSKMVRKAYKLSVQENANLKYM